MLSIAFDQTDQTTDKPVDTIVGVKPEYHARVVDIPSDDRPRERLKKHGEASLSNSDLLAITLRAGTTRENVMELATKLLIYYAVF
jgi:hypothetical protein